MEYMPAALRAGMTVTNEPGIYLADRFGVRIENTCLIKDYMETELGRFLQMESLTLCPIDLAPVDCSLLTAEEKQWLNDYHQMVCEKLAPPSRWRRLGLSSGIIASPSRRNLRSCLRNHGNVVSIATWRVVDEPGKVLPWLRYPVALGLPLRALCRQ